MLWLCHGFRLSNQVGYFKSILISFDGSIIFRGNWMSSENCLEPKITTIFNFSFPNPQIFERLCVSVNYTTGSFQTDYQWMYIIFYGLCKPYTFCIILQNRLLTQREGNDDLKLTLARIRKKLHRQSSNLNCFLFLIFQNRLFRWTRIQRRSRQNRRGSSKRYLLFRSEKNWHFRRLVTSKNFLKWSNSTKYFRRNFHRHCRSPTLLSTHLNRRKWLAHIDWCRFQMLHRWHLKFEGNENFYQRNEKPAKCFRRNEIKHGTSFQCLKLWFVFVASYEFHVQMANDGLVIIILLDFTT